MSLCYDFQKWTIVTFASVAITLIVGLFILVAHGQTVDNQTVSKEQVDGFNALINYCFLHADRPNPIHDLVDKGFLPPAFNGETCMSVRQQYDKLANILAIQEAKKEKESLAYKAMLTNELNKKMNTTEKYAECARNFSKTQEECNRITEAIK